MFAEIDDFYQRMKNRLEHCRKERKELAEILDFYGKVLSAQQEAQQETPIPEIDLTEDRLNLKIEEGFPLMDSEDFSVDRNSLERLFRNLCHLSSTENPVLASAGEILHQAMDSGTLDVTRLGTAVLDNNAEAIEEYAKDLGVPQPVLQTLAKLSLQPSLLATAAVVGKGFAAENWQQSYCPICGGLPAIAALVGEEGKREALCSFCGHFWQLPRLQCPFCSTEKQEDLRYFYGEGEDLYRVYVCEHCKGYIKVVDTREHGDPRGLAVDDVVTTHLDLLAEDEGYRRKAPRLWGI
ncbi:MAG: formate dehydrogenase accessory protein FdhE [Syntrophobacterales bacterium]|jgi:FdhE protein